MRSVTKPWGMEFIWAEGAGYTAKILLVDAHMRLSLQKHTQKHETLLLYGGAATYNNTPMSAMMSVEVPPGTVHRIAAGAAGAIILEASSPEEGSTLRLADDFGRADPNEAEQT